MYVIPLKQSTIKRYMGSHDFNGCRDISKIHAIFRDGEPGNVDVEARIPGSSTRASYYVISVSLQINPGGVTRGRREKPSTRIVGSDCTCPVHIRCKHINAVLHRISHSPNHPIPAPNQEYMARQERNRRMEEATARGASIYIAFACKSEEDSGSDFRRSYYTKESFDQEVLGVFFSVALANECARNHVRDELGYEIDEMDDNDDDDDEGYEYCFDSSDLGEYDGDNYVDKVWVECRAIEDASTRFHP